MSFLLDTNILSAFLKGHRQVFNRFLQHSGGLSTSSLCAAELYTWASRKQVPPQRLDSLHLLLSEITILPFDLTTAQLCGHLRGQLLDSGRPLPIIDLMIASTALAHDLTLVTHNTRDFEPVSTLRLTDWITDS